MKSIVDLLKETNSRVSLDDKWMIWDEGMKSWIVYEKKYRQRGVTTVIETESEEEAIERMK